MNAETGFFRTQDGARIAYATSGTGHPMVRAATWATHIGHDQEVWGHWWRELSRSRSLVRYDLRGSGLSDSPSPNPTLESRVDDLETLVDHLRLDRFDLFGHSQGAATALAFSIRHPGRVSRLVLFGGFARGGDHRGVPLEEREARLVLMSKGWEEDVSPYRLMVASRLQPDAPQALDALMRTSITGQNATLVSRLSGAIDLVDQLPGIDIPTLVAHSRDDLSVSIRESHLLASLIPGARLLEIQSRNHVLTSTEPGWSEFLVGLRGFLSDGSGSQTRDGSGTSATPGGLTDREVEVLRLISNGHTDKAIADVLGVSVRTVGSYVQNVLEKSQSASRAQAAVWGARQGVL